MAVYKNTIVVTILFLFLFLFLFSDGSASAEREKVIIAFGDSITVGAWENEQCERDLYGKEVCNGARVGGYEPDLETLTDFRNNHHDVLNYGYAGEKTIDYQGRKGGLRRLVEDVLPNHQNARYALILEGTNDYWTQVSKETTVRNLGLMVDACRSYGIEPILATLTPDTTPYKGYLKNIPKYNTMISELAMEKSVTLVDMYSAMIGEWESRYAYGPVPWDANYLDYLHLSREGHNRMAELWFAALDIPILAQLPWLQLLLKEN